MGWLEPEEDSEGELFIGTEEMKIALSRPQRFVKPPNMTPAQYAEFMAKHAKAGKRTNTRRRFFSNGSE